MPRREVGLIGGLQCLAYVMGVIDDRFNLRSNR